MSDPAISLDTLFDQATSALKAGQVDIAIRDYERILQQAPHDTSTLNNLAIALKRVGRLEAAIRHYETLIRLQPDAISYYNLGNAYHEHGQITAAIAAFQQSLALGPQPNTYVNLGISLYDAGDPAGAIAAYHQALQLDPHSGYAHTNLGLALLMQGDWQAGWEEWRWQAERTLFPTLPLPHWQGGDLRGKTLLLHTEGGFGDTLQFIRYAECLVEQGATVGVMCALSLHRLLQAMPAISWVVAPKTAYPPVDAHTLLLSVPKYLGTTLETLPATIPYLSAPLSKPALTPAAGTRLKVGVTWASGAYQGAFLQLFQQRKTCPLSVFAELFSLSDVSFYSLQVGQDPGEWAALCQSQGWGDRLFDLSPAIRDFADTAAWVEQLDLVISVDTSVVHLAGALGKPTWVLLPYMCDWRWGRDRADTPWYPSLRLFRQPQPGDWHSVINTVKAALQQWSPAPPAPTRPSLAAVSPLVHRSSPSDSSHPAIADNPFRQGTAALQAGDWETAIRCYQSILATHPHSGAAHHNLAVALRLQGGPDHLPLAIEHFRQAIALQTPTAGMHYNLANALREAQDWSAAIAHYQAALALQPNYPEAALGLGQVYVAQENFAAAIATYSQLLDRQPDNAEVHEHLGRALAAQGEGVASTIAYQQAERLRRRHTLDHRQSPTTTVVFPETATTPAIWLSNDRDLDLDELRALFETVAWPQHPPRQLKQALQHSLQVVSLWVGRAEQRQLIGFARATSDQVSNATLWDVMVHPNYQGQGLGKALVRYLIQQLASADIQQITLFADPPVVGFYRKLGFLPDLAAKQHLVLYLDQPTRD